MWPPRSRRHGYVSYIVCLPCLTLRAPGFFGPVPGSLLRQVGRGYTDLLAALLAAGLGASELQIWKEVDGIFTADPRKVPTARLIPIISPEEAAELTYYGSEVVHPFTMEQVIRRKIPIRIKNVENPQGGGTVIHPDADMDAAPYPEDDMLGAFAVSGAAPTSRGEHGDQTERKLPTAVTIKERIVVLNVNSNRKSVSHGFLAGVFGTLDRYGVVVDLISTSEVYVSMAIEDGLDKKVLDRVVRELRKSGTVSSLHPLLQRASTYNAPALPRSPSAVTWLFCLSWAPACEIWSASQGGCSPRSAKGTSISR